MYCDVKYRRVIPRDLFNEAKLLKCMGRLVLKIQDNETPCRMSHSENGLAFHVGITKAGYLTIANLEIAVKRKIVPFATTYNSKANYPLIAFWENCEYRVFNEEGEWDEEFIHFVNNVLI